MPAVIKLRKINNGVQSVAKCSSAVRSNKQSYHLRKFDSHLQTIRDRPSVRRTPHHIAPMASMTTSSSSGRRLAVAALAALCVLVILCPPPAVSGCSCMPTHPQEHYCNADYVIIARVLRERKLPHSNVYKIAIKKSYKMNESAAKVLREGKLTTAAEDSMCGRPLTVGKVYVIAGSSAQVSLCSYAQPYAQMTQVEKRGFAGGYRKGCACEISMHRFGAPGQCEWSPWEECETKFGACVPSRGAYNETSRPSKCHWRSSPLYNECRNMP